MSVNATSTIFRTAAFGLGAAALLSLGLVRPAAAQAPPLSATSHNYIYTVAFNTPTPFLSYTAGDILFTFDPTGLKPVPASITAGNVTYSSGDWNLDTTNIGTFGSVSRGLSITYPFLGPTVTITNAQPTAGSPDNGFLVPVTQWGKSFGFTFAYADPPTGTDPSDFSLVLQSQTAGQPNVSMFDLQFSAAGGVTLVGAAPGVTITPQGGAPVPTPEASTTVSLGLMLLLGLGGAVLARKKAR